MEERMGWQRSELAVCAVLALCGRNPNHGQPDSFFRGAAPDLFSPRKTVCLRRVFELNGNAPGLNADVSDIVEAVLYLDSAPFVPGEILHVDGGQSAGHHALRGAARGRPVCLSG